MPIPKGYSVENCKSCDLPVKLTSISHEQAAFCSASDDGLQMVRCGLYSACGMVFSVRKLLHTEEERLFFSFQEGSDSIVHLFTFSPPALSEISLIGKDTSLV